jgi:hypothetical protein
MSVPEGSPVEPLEYVKIEPSGSVVCAGDVSYPERNSAIIYLDTSRTANITNARDRKTQEIDQLMISFPAQNNVS